MRVLLVNPPYVGWLNDVKVEPIGLLYIASFLRQRGHEVALYDPYIGEDQDAFLDLMSTWKPRMVAIGVYTVNEQFCFDLAELTKQLDPGVFVVAGGPHATFVSRRMLTSAARSTRSRTMNPKKQWPRSRPASNTDSRSETFPVSRIADPTGT